MLALLMVLQDFDRWAADLARDDIEVREAAEARFVEAGWEARDYVRGLLRSPDAEVTMRARAILEVLEADLPELARVVELMDAAGVVKERRVVLELPGGAGDRAVRVNGGAVQRLAAQPVFQYRQFAWASSSKQIQVQESWNDWDSPSASGSEIAVPIGAAAGPIELACVNASGKATWKVRLDEKVMREKAVGAALVSGGQEESRLAPLPHAGDVYGAQSTVQWRVYPD